MNHDERRARREEVAKRLLNGEDSASIAKALNLSVASVYQTRSALGIKSSAQKALHDAIDRLSRGESIADASRAAGVSCERLYRNARANGIALPSRARFKSYAVLARLINTADTLGVIAADFGVTRQAIHQIQQRAVEAGIALHPQRSARCAR